MARPKSEEKRQLLLDAAARVIAERGDGAPTALIAKVAGVAEGTLFTYFRTKEELLNELYGTLLAELYASARGVPSRGKREKLHHAWTRTLAWGLANPKKRAALRVLDVSGYVPERRRLDAADRGNRFLAEAIGVRDEPPGFPMAVLGAVAEATLKLMIQQPRLAEAYSAAGFEACWKIVSQR
ncbi:MAG TPA: helix-turn-helix domain-containing protein [Anaeromyxobacteraceae bacterium]|nr:helix-turn-helix domain-containing protein [Anaeromyxobacteraceae bacterium]